MNRALRLHAKHNQAELAEMLDRVQADPNSKQSGFSLYTPKARKLMDDILWAIYWHQAPSGNAKIRRGPEQGKYW